MRNLLALAVLVLVSACSSTSDLGIGKGGQSFVVSGYKYDQVWDAALAGTKTVKSGQPLESDAKLNIEKADKQAGRIEASTGMGWWSYGEVVGVFIAPPADATEYKIEVQSRAKLRTNITAKDWEKSITQSIKDQLILMKNSK